MRYSDFLKENYDIMLELINHMRVGLWFTDSSGTVLMVNDESMKTGGLKREEIVGKTMSQLVDMGYITESSAMAALVSGEEQTVIEEMGEGGHCLAVTVPVKDHGKVDITI